MRLGCYEYILKALLKIREEKQRNIQTNKLRSQLELKQRLMKPEI
jgi:hypothetical protein